MNSNLEATRVIRAHGGEKIPFVVEREGRQQTLQVTPKTTKVAKLDADGNPVHLADIWPSSEEIKETISEAVRQDMFERSYADVFSGDERWRELHTDDDAEFDTVVHIDAASLTPFVTWGTNPGQGLPLADEVPDPDQIADPEALTHG